MPLYRLDPSRSAPELKQPSLSSTTTNRTLSTPGIPPRTGFSLKEYEEQLNTLKKENFNLKLRIYFAEERKEQMKSIKSIEDAQQKIIDLSVQIETFRKELSEKDELLVETAKAMDVLQRSYQTKSESLQIISAQKDQLESQKALLETQNEVLKKDLIEIKQKLAAIRDHSSSISQCSFSSQQDVKEKKTQSVACQQSYVDLPSSLKKLEHKGTSPCAVTPKLNEDSVFENASLREQLSKILIENTKAMETIQYLMRANKRLRQQIAGKKESGSSNYDQMEEQRSGTDKLTDELKAEIDRLNRELHEVNEVSRQLKQEVDKWTSTAEERESEFNKVLKYLEEKNTKVNELQQELRELELKLQLSESVKDIQGEGQVWREKQELKWLIDEKEKENNRLKIELRKRTFNLQELVNKELWNKNREIEKLNKLCERRQTELVAVKAALKTRSNDIERILSEKYGENIIACTEEFKENSKPTCCGDGNRFVMSQLEAAVEEKAKLTLTIKELRRKLAEFEMTEVMVESLRKQCANAKAETDVAEKMLKESMDACQLLTTRLEELSGFLDSLLTQDNFTSLSEEKKRALRDAVTQSRLLSKSLSASFNVDVTFNAESTMELSLKCPSVEPILPDYSEINFSSEEDNVTDVTLEQINAEPEIKPDETDSIKQLRSEVIELTEKLKSTDLDGKELRTEIDSEQSSENVLPPFDIHETDPVRTVPELSLLNRFDPMFSVNGKMYDKSLSSSALVRFKKSSAENLKKLSSEYGCLSESESWSEPDRTASLARIGLSKESIAFRNPCSETETSDLEELSSARLSGKKSKKIYGKSMKQKLRSFEEMNASLRQEIQSLHSVISSVSNKISDEEMMRQLRNLNSQLSNSHTKCAELEKQLITANTRCQTLLVLLDDAERKSKDSMNSEKRAKTLEFESETLKAKLEGSSTEKRVDSLERECQLLKAKLEESNAELAPLMQMKSQYNATLRELESAKMELENERDEHLSTRENVTQLKDEIKRIQNLLQDRSECILEKECALLEAQNKLKECAIEFELKMKETNDRCVISEKHAKEVENRLLDATNKLQIAESKLNELKSRLQVAEDEYEALKHKLNQHKAEFCMLKHEADELKYKLDQREAESCTLKHELSHRSADYNTLKSQCEKEVAVLKSQLENFRLEEEKNAELHKSMLMEMSQQIETLRQERQEALEMVENWRCKVDELIKERERIVSSKLEQEKKAEKLAKAEKVARETEAGLRYQLQAASSQCAYAESHARSLEKQYKLRERELKAWYNEREAELRRQLDNATLTTSEVVLERTRLANDKLRLQQELRSRHKSSRHEEELERVKRELERRVAELEAANGEMETKLTNIYVYKECYSDCENTSAGEESLLGSPLQITPLNVDTANDAQTSQRLWQKGETSPRLKTCISTLTYHNHVYLRQRSNENSSDYVSDQELALPLQLNEKSEEIGTCSPDLGIESDQGRASSSEQVALCKSNSVEFQKLEEENVTLRNKLFRTKQALEETLTQLSTANKKKRQVENAICKQLHKTHHILKKARVNLELRSDSTGQEASDHQ